MKKTSKTEILLQRLVAIEIHRLRPPAQIFFSCGQCHQRYLPVCPFCGYARLSTNPNSTTLHFCIVCNGHVRAICSNCRSLVYPEPKSAHPIRRPSKSARNRARKS